MGACFLLKCIELMGDGCLNNEHFEELGGILKGKLEEHFKNQELRQGESSLQQKKKFEMYLKDYFLDLNQGVCLRRVQPGRHQIS